ncbi:MAG TPA: DUF1549 domain-containing protein [Pirellulales bacterium]|nr:DUF1549 domain-containing protein [Pirellulales bacterium]
MRQWKWAFVGLAVLAAAAWRLAAVEAAAPKLPDMSTAEAKLKALEYFRQRGPWKTIKHSGTLVSKDIDKSLEKEKKLPDDRYAPLADDETFLRRATFDLTGRPPEAKEVQAFLADKDKEKRAKLIDRLLETDEFARRWAHFWRTVMFYNTSVDKSRLDYAAFENWLAGMFNQHAGWDQITAQILAADGKKKEVGPDNFILACENQPTQLASETARVFMGVSIQCAECHNHPFDRWKREQFHELAAFFSPGRYYMPDLQQPDNKTEMSARFLLGETPPPNLKADARRVAVAAFLVYNPNNYWFARAYVNRIWSELIGDGFYAVDSLGPDGDVAHKLIVNRMAYVFRNQQFDSRWPFRMIMNTRLYQRKIRAPKSSEDMFTAVRPSRLRPDQVAQSLVRIVGEGKLTAEVERIFAVDPSIPLSDVEGSIQQSLFLMNNPALQAAIKNGPLTQRLAKIPADEQLVDELYLDVLSRKPTAAERRRSAEYLKSVPNRAEATADLVWVLVNSTEFICRR